MCSGAWSGQLKLLICAASRLFFFRIPAGFQPALFSQYMNGTSPKFPAGFPKPTNQKKEMAPTESQRGCSSWTVVAPRRWRFEHHRASRKRCVAAGKTWQTAVVLMDKAHSRCPINRVSSYTVSGGGTQPSAISDDIRACSAFWFECLLQIRVLLAWFCLTCPKPVDL